MKTKEKPFWEEKINPITMWKYSVYEDERSLSKSYLKKNKKNDTSL